MFHIPFHTFSPRRKRIASKTRIMTLLSNTIESSTTLPSQWLRFENRQWDQTWVPPIIRRNDNPTWNPYQWWARSGDVQDILTQLKDLTWWIVQGNKACKMWHNNELPRGHILYRQKYWNNLCGRDTFRQLPIIHQYSEKSQLTELSTCSRIGDALDIDHIPIWFDVGIVGLDKAWECDMLAYIPMICHIILYHQNILISRVHCSNGQRANKYTVNHVVKSL